MLFGSFITYLVAMTMRQKFKRINKRRKKILLILLKVERAKGVGDPQMWIKNSLV